MPETDFDVGIADGRKSGRIGGNGKVWFANVQKFDYRIKDWHAYWAGVDAGRRDFAEEHQPEPAVSDVKE